AVGIATEGKLSSMQHPFDHTKTLQLDQFTHEPLLEKVIGDGKRMIPHRSTLEVAEYSKSRLALLPIEYKRFQNPHIYKIGLSPNLKAERDKLIELHKI